MHLLQWAVVNDRLLAATAISIDLAYTADAVDFAGSKTAAVAIASRTVFRDSQVRFAEMNFVADSAVDNIHLAAFPVDIQSAHQIADNAVIHCMMLLHFYRSAGVGAAFVGVHVLADMTVSVLQSFAT